eukprot:1026405-Pelagomonas_calceolata.AAC.1
MASMPLLCPQAPSFGIKAPLLSSRPLLCPQAPSFVYGYVAGMYGALKGIPISGCLGDQMAAVLGKSATIRELFVHAEKPYPSASPGSWKKQSR